MDKTQVMENASLLTHKTLISIKKEDRLDKHGVPPTKRLFRVPTLDPSPEFIGPWGTFGDPGQPRLEAKSKLLEAAKLHVHIGLNTYLGKINTRVPISSYELSTLNSASSVVLEENWVSHR
ncbi:hypothetical protein Tco_1404219 [Tanacetum coccineum]